MPITAGQIQAAELAQHAAAQDGAQRIRLVAGPGTGKSSSIAERVRWLLSDCGVPPANLFVVSFTRASARDLRRKIHRYCGAHGAPTAVEVSVSTLHSLALGIQQAAGQLQAYPVDPLVMDKWELKTIFDAELARQTGATPTRCKEVRVDHEAFWNTGAWAPPNYVPPQPPITAAERNAFVAFHGLRSQLYAAVLPGEIVRKCVEDTARGIMNPAQLMGITHMIVDEYQDLNPVDQRFVNDLIGAGVVTFIAGDDDQSIYSFRYASPEGIQDFTNVHAGAAAHALTDCFRCTPAVLASASDLISAHPLPNRIPKALASLYTGATPPLTGHVHRWFFRSDVAEARAIAASCRDLINRGVSANEILILMSDSDILEGKLAAELTDAGVAHRLAKDALLSDSDAGRLALAILRIVCEADDYVAHRTLLGYMPNVGVGTCDQIAVAVVQHGLNFKDLFYQPLPAGLFTGRRLTGLTAARNVIAQLGTWQPIDTLAQRGAEIGALLGRFLSPADEQKWTAATAHLPPDLELGEVRDYVWADDSERQAEILNEALQRMGQAPGAAIGTPAQVRLMTMHGAKGLDAQVVFIPGLEEQLLPGPWRRPYPGRVLEAARMLYVSISRARAACILTYTRSRWMYAARKAHTASRFATNVGGPFQDKRANGGGLTGPECDAIFQECLLL